MATKKPDQRLKGQVASIAQLRAYSTTERRARTCATCDITYTSEAARKQCARHHQTG
jgi:hypothetical protein